MTLVQQPVTLEPNHQPVTPVPRLVTLVLNPRPVRLAPRPATLAHRLVTHVHRLATHVHRLATLAHRLATHAHLPVTLVPLPVTLVVVLHSTHIPWVENGPKVSRPYALVPLQLKWMKRSNLYLELVATRRESKVFK